MAIILVVRCATLNGWTSIIVEGDNKETMLAAEDLYKGRRHSSLPLAKEQLRYWPGFTMISFSFVPRAINVLAHRMVKMEHTPLYLRLYP